MTRFHDRLQEVWEQGGTPAIGTGKTIRLNKRTWLEMTDAWPVWAATPDRFTTDFGTFAVIWDDRLPDGTVIALSEIARIEEDQP